MPNIPELKIGNTTYKLKDGDLRQDIILAKSTQPTEECNKIWVNEAASEEYEVPTYNEFEIVTERTVNLFNPCALPFKLEGATYSVNGDAITVTSENSSNYRSVQYIVDVNDINTITCCPFSAQGTGSQTVRIGYSNDGLTFGGWISGSSYQANEYRTLDVSNYAYIVVALYAVYSSGGETGKTTTYKNIIIVEGSAVHDYIPYLSAADYILRNALVDPMEGKIETISDNSLANTNIWEAGTISNVTGENTSQQNSIRTKKFLQIPDNKKKVFFQAYYEYPDSTVAEESSGNYNLRNAYLYKYNKDGTFISRVNLPMTNGGFITVDDECKYVRIALYTRLVNTTIADIMPGTIVFYALDPDDKYPLPYYYESYLAQKAATIESYARSAAGDGVVFLFITDEHAPQYSGMRSVNVIRSLAKRVHIPFLFSGGDVDQNGTQTSVYCNALRECFDGEIHHAVGNHDFLNLNTGLSLAYDMDMYNNNQVGSMEHHYYYVDNPQLKIRFIVLAAYMESESAMGTGSGTAAQGGYTQEQKDWIFNEALDFPEGWQAIVFTHYFYMISGENRTATLSYGGDILQQLANNPDVIAVFQGHTHHDRIIKGLDSIAGDLPIVISTSDKNVEYHDEEQWEMNRASGTIYEVAFDVVIINRKTKMINMVRIGGLAMNGLNNSNGTQAEERSISYDRE